ncbi:MAG TPA: DNA repair protein RecO [Beijerinckiaceae bacterium]|jgi:DNA repair protein RecO (recombination protein O)
MQWSDEGLVLGLRRHGEAAAILEVMTRDHGRHNGLVHGGRSRRMQPVLQPGNTVHLTWRARLDEQLGTFTVEPGTERAARLLGSKLALYGLGTLSAHLRLLPERDPHPGLYETATVLADHLDDPELAPALMVRFEMAVLNDLGVGLDLSACAATGSRTDLIYVSPKSGRAVSAGAGEPYKDRLLKLPGFLVGQTRSNTVSAEDLAAGFRLTGHFLRETLQETSGAVLPDERERFVAAALQER